MVWETMACYKRILKFKKKKGEVMLNAKKGWRP